MNWPARLPIVLGLALAPLTAAFLSPAPDDASREGTEEVAAEPRSSRALLGLWQATTPEREGDVVRFYYFHDRGIGLVRYGRMGLTYTRTFHWKVAGDELVLVFNKDGEHHKVAFLLEENDRVLHLPSDPAFPGDHRYRKDLRPRGFDFASADHPLARLWVHPTKDRRGGRGFRMYQLQPPTIDGRGVGWYHEGDMSEWSTETLTYRRTGDSLELVFSLRNERASTTIALRGEGRERSLTLAEDPRNFWHERAYKDEGPGFTVALEGVPLPYHVPGHGPHRALGAPHGAREKPSCFHH